MKAINRIVSLILCLCLVLSLAACGNKISSLNITNGEKALVKIGYTLQLKTDAPEDIANSLTWQTSNGNITVDKTGFVTAINEGNTTVIVSYQDFSDTIVIWVASADDYERLYPEFADDDRNEQTGNGSSSELTQRPHKEQNENNGQDDDRENTTNPNITYPDNPKGVDEVARAKFYNGSDPADSYEEALARSKVGKLSGCETVPNQAPVVANYRPKQSGAYIKNSEAYFIDKNTYVVVNSYGYEVFRVYRGGGYITLEEVAAYLMAFGEVPANYVSKKSTKPTSSIWKQYLRVNNTKFSGSTTKYPYEPELPRISGCGGDLQYYEIDIGTTGTDCDPSYPVRTYNNGVTIERGAARIVYSRYDKNGNNIIEMDEKYVFYTYNHYNDFQEYLNYYNGWGTMFGNITGGGVLSSETKYNPTPYVNSILSPIKSDLSAAA